MKHHNLRYTLYIHSFTYCLYLLILLVGNIIFGLFRYYQCFWGQTYSFSCPAGTLWSNQRQYCDWSYNVQCKFILTFWLFLLKKYPNLTNDNYNCCQFHCTICATRNNSCFPILEILSAYKNPKKSDFIRNIIKHNLR